LTGEFGRGFSVVNLKNFRQSCLVFPKGYCEGDVPEDEIGYTVCSEFLLVALPVPDAGGKSRARRCRYQRTIPMKGSIVSGARSPFIEMRAQKKCTRSVF